MAPYFEWRVVAAVILLCLSGFFSGAEAVFFTILGRGALVNFEKDKPGLATVISRLLASPGRLISSILVGNVIVNIFFSVIIAAIFSGLLLGAHPRSDGKSFVVGALSMVVSTGLLLVFGEVMPKTMGVRFHRRLSSAMTLPLYWFTRLALPLEFLFRKISEAALRLIGIQIGEARQYQEREIVELVEAGGEEGVLEETEYALLKNVFAFGDLTAVEVMTPRQEIFSLPLEMDYSELKRRLLASGYSRVPIYQKSPDQITGIITAKDILKLDLALTKSINHVLRRPFCVPPQKKLDDLLRDFLTNNIHIALVVNEYGEVMGLITLEDLLGQIFGESAEQGVEEEELVEAGENRWLVSGRTEIRSFNERMDTFLYAPGIKTLAGFLLNEFGRVPAVLDEIVREGFRFRVKEIRRRQIHRVEVEKLGG